jgi:hypothetical protein
MRRESLRVDCTFALPRQQGGEREEDDATLSLQLKGSQRAHALLDPGWLDWLARPYPCLGTGGREGERENKQ